MKKATKEGTTKCGNRINKIKVEEYKRRSSVGLQSGMRKSVVVAGFYEQ